MFSLYFSITAFFAGRAFLLNDHNHQGLLYLLNERKSQNVTSRKFGKAGRAEWAHLFLAAVSVKEGERNLAAKGIGDQIGLFLPAIDRIVNGMARNEVFDPRVDSISIKPVLGKQQALRSMLYQAIRESKS